MVTLSGSGTQLCSDSQRRALCARGPASQALIAPLRLRFPQRPVRPGAPRRCPSLSLSLSSCFCVFSTARQRVQRSAGGRGGATAEQRETFGGSWGQRERLCLLRLGRRPGSSEITVPALSPKARGRRSSGTVRDEPVADVLLTDHGRLVKALEAEQVTGPQGGPRTDNLSYYCR